MNSRELLSDLPLAPRMGFLRSLYADALILLLRFLQWRYKRTYRSQMANLRRRDRLLAELVRVTDEPVRLGKEKVA